MAFSLTEDQTLLKDAADGFFADKAPVAGFRKLRDSKETLDPSLWGEIGAMGFAGAMIGENHGGSDMGLRAMGLVLEAQARTLGVSPLFQTGLMAPSILKLQGNTVQQDDYLPKIADGSLTFALALDEGAHHAPQKIETRATKTAGGWSLAGKKRFVPDGAHARILIVIAQTDAGLGAFLVAGDAPGVTRHALSGVDSRDLADVTLDAVSVGDGAYLGDKPLDEATLDLILDHGRIGLCWEMMGLIGATFDMTHDYLKTRTQFGQLIGSFQALQHRAATMLVEIELTRSCVVAAIDAIERGKGVGEAVSLAKARTGDTLQLVTNETIQMHGGIGMTDAHDSGFYLKRARVLETAYGSSGFHRDRWAKLNAY
jgi:alkylation response protein AidB-like acyl-CoA dehydrogenase